MAEVAKQVERSVAGDELLSVIAGGQEFAMDIMCVREIRGWVGSTALPQSPSYIKGVVNLRGLVLPIIDLPMRLGFDSGEPTSTSVVVVVETSGQVVGLLVEAVCDILTVTEDITHTVPYVGAKHSSNAVVALLTFDDKIVSVLNLDKILPLRSAEEANAAA